MDGWQSTHIGANLVVYVHADLLMTVAELGRPYYGYGKNCSEEDLLDYHGMPHTPQTLSTTREWLAEARDAESSCGISVQDLYYWEVRMGNWQAMSGAEFDIARDYFTPFNCRELLATTLAVSERYRKGPKWELSYRTISRLWPEALVEPINPVTAHEIVWQDLLSLAHHVPGYWTFRNLLKGRP